MVEEHIMSRMEVLSRIDSPKDLKRLSRHEMKRLAGEIRQRILEVVSKTGGHLGGPLGTVELSIALHYVLDTPKDKIVWDTGHQSYPHKLLTGRNDKFDTLRQFKGICGFCNIEESEYDTFGAGHAATSISAALGMAKARDLKGEKHRVVAVIGDGALSAGLAYEGLNNAGGLKSDLLVILNDNEMSISPNVGAMSTYLQKSVTLPHYRTVRQKTADMLRRIPGVTEEDVRKLFSLEGKVRNFTGPGMLFEELGFRYFGPIDGHNLEETINAIRNLKDMRGPILLHVLTQKGKGYKFAEEDTDKLHGMSPFNVTNGQKHKGAPGPVPYTKAFSKALLSLAENNQKICAITAAMKSGVGMDAFERQYPQRFFDVGIAEQHAATFAAGLAIQGMRPVCAIYSTFLQRSYDMIIHDIAIQNLPVVFAIDRAGLVGDDGPTHNGPFDIAYLRMIPNMTVMVPKDENEVQHMLCTALSLDGPSSLRYPRGNGMGVELDETPKKLSLGKGEVLRTAKKSKKICVLGVGPVLYDALAAAEEENLDVTVVNARFVKPLDRKLIVKLAKSHKHLVTIEEGTAHGGFGSGVLELLAEEGVQTPVKVLAIPDEFIEHGKPAIQKSIAGIDKKRIKEVLISLT